MTNEFRSSKGKILKSIWVKEKLLWGKYHIFRLSIETRTGDSEILLSLACEARKCFVSRAPFRLGHPDVDAFMKIYDYLAAAIGEPKRVVDLKWWKNQGGKFISVPIGLPTGREVQLGGASIHLRINNYKARRRYVFGSNNDVSIKGCDDIVALGTFLGMVKSMYLSGNNTNNNSIHDLFIRTYGSKNAGKLRYYMNKSRGYYIDPLLGDLEYPYDVDAKKIADFAKQISTWGGIEQLGYIDNGSVRYLVFRPQLKKKTEVLQVMPIQKECNGSSRFTFKVLVDEGDEILHLPRVTEALESHFAK